VVEIAWYLSRDLLHRRFLDGRNSVENIQGFFGRRFLGGGNSVVFI
jgi:hypothetical protein